MGAYMRYDELDVYKLPYELALYLHKRSQKFPKNEQYGGLADQIRRASKGICANIAEGLSKHASDVEQRRYLGMALGSCEEVNVWLSFCRDLAFITEADCQKLGMKYQSVAKMLYALMERRNKVSRKAA